MAHSLCIWYFIIITLDIQTTYWSCLFNAEVLRGLASQTGRCSYPTQHSGWRGVWHHIRQRYQIFLTLHHHRVFSNYTDRALYTVPKDMQTFTAAESTEPLKDPDPAKETEKPEGGKGMRAAADFCQILSGNHFILRDAL